MILAVIISSVAGAGKIYLRGKEYEIITIEVEGQIIEYVPRLISMQTIPYADTVKINSVLRDKGYKVIICRQFGKTGHYTYLIELPKSEDSYYLAPILASDEALASDIDYCIPSYASSAPEDDNVTESEGLENGPVEFGQNYPNPFNQETEIKLLLNGELHTTVQIYNIQGRLVKTLVEKKMPAGVHTVHWNGRDDRNRQVPTGVYFLRFRAGEAFQTQKMVLIK